QSDSVSEYGPDLSSTSSLKLQDPPLQRNISFYNIDPHSATGNETGSAGTVCREVPAGTKINGAVAQE
ncbi:MAG: hypothetical protein J6W44_06035, partial [Oscillospiraceae bacterium]|nr:hypothetical protein [Oscillospiraceae bacterium]